MTELLAVPLKKPSEVEISKPLKNLIASAYSSSGTNAAQDYSDAVTEFSKLRNTAIWKVFEKYESSLDIIYK
jgi:programmed cell death 6-interacting protein